MTGVYKKLQLLKSKGLKLGREKKFRGLYPPSLKATILEIAEDIGNVVGLDNVIVEPVLPSGDADIKFVDDDEYFLQVKSPQFLFDRFGYEFSIISGRFERFSLQKSYVLVAQSYPVLDEIVQRAARAVLLFLPRLARY